MGLKISNLSDTKNLYNSIKRIEQGSSIDHVVKTFPEIKRNFLFLVLQEYYRNYENHNKILLKYIDEINFDLISTRGTAIGSALAISTNRMRSSDSMSKIIILLSDGDNTAGILILLLLLKSLKLITLKYILLLLGKMVKYRLEKIILEEQDLSRTHWTKKI